MGGKLERGRRGRIDTGFLMRCIRVLEAASIADAKALANIIEAANDG